MSLPRVGRSEPDGTDCLQWAERPCLTVFGPMSVMVDGELVQPGPPRQRAVLALLLVNARQVVPVSTLIESIWEGHPPERVTATLQSYVSRLRVLLTRSGSAPALHWRAPGYLLAVRPDQADVGRFELAVAHGRESLRCGRAAAAQRSLSLALRLWSGQPYAELAGYGFAKQEATRLDQIRLAAVEGRADACFQLRQDDEVLEVLGREVEQNPLRESLVLRLMRAQYRVGRQADALQVYEQVRTRLADELGADPGRDLQHLHRAILRQDPSLDPATRPGRAVSRREFTPAPGGPLISATGPPAPQHPLRLPFVGRSHLIEQLAGRPIGASGQRGRVVLVTGTAGTGKSRLLLELADRLTADGTDVLWAFCPPEDAPPLWPWRQVLRRLLGGWSPAGLPAPAERIVRAVAGGDEHAPASAPAFDVADAVCQAVLAAAVERRRAVLVEDVQWADARSLAVLRLLAQQAHQAPLLLVATARGYETTDPTAHPDMPRTLSALDGSPAATVIRLSELHLQNTAALVRAVIGEPASAGIAADLHERTGGNPLLLTQLLASLESARGAGAALERIPDAVRSTVRQWLARLPRCVRDELEMCAVLDRDADRALPPDVPLIGRDGRDPTRVAIGAGLLAPSGRRLAHPLVGEVIMTDLPRVRLSWVHAAAAKALVARGADAQTTDAEPILRHAGAVAGLAGAVRAVRPLLYAAHLAERARDTPQALAWVRHAVSLIGRSHDRRADAEIEVLLQLHRARLGAAVHGFRSQDVDAAHARAEELCRRVRLPLRATVLRARCLTRLVTGQYEEVNVLAAELDEVGVQGDREAAVTACLSRGAARHEQGRLDEALAEFDRGAALASAAGSRPGDPAAVAVSCYITLTHWFQGAREAASARSRALLSATAVVGVRPVARVFALYVDSVLAALDGNVEQASRSGQAGIVLASRSGLSYWRDMTAVPYGWALVHRGQADAGLGLIRTALASAARSEVWLRRALHLRLLADAEHRAGHNLDACRTLRTMVVHARCRREELYLRPGTQFTLPPL